MRTVHNYILTGKDGKTPPSALGWLKPHWTTRTLFTSLDGLSQDSPLPQSSTD